jgi:hypothetical protein
MGVGAGKSAPKWKLRFENCPEDPKGQLRIPFGFAQDRLSTSVRSAQGDRFIKVGAKAGDYGLGRSEARNSSGPRVFSTSSGVSQARRNWRMP